MMPDSMVNIGAYNPLRTTAMVPHFGPEHVAAIGNDGDPESGKDREKLKDEQSGFAPAADTLELSREAIEIRELQLRDQEVRAHEAAHAAAGGSYAGAPTYDYQRGPDGRTYAVGGSVNIDISPIPGDPQATLQKARQVRAAALAPAQPSAQDMKVAQQAQALATEARNEMSQEQIAERQRQLNHEQDAESGFPVEPGMSAYARGIHDPGPARLEVYS
ncbi:MAG: putative metalloprotease CJM1_0395 family protein [Pelovirga sp.]